MKVALVYDRVNKFGGAERVLLVLHELFPDAPLFTSVYHHETTPWVKSFSVQTSFLQHVPFASSHHEFFPYLMPLAFESFDFSEYDLVISVTSEAAKGILTTPHTTHICYCLTPTRYLWSGYEEYFPTAFSQMVTVPVISYLRKWDYIAAQRVDAYIAISKEVQQRLKKYYKRESTVVYPPLSLDEFNENDRKQKQPFFLVVSRFVPYKRIDLAIQACNNLSLPLYIIGVGSEEQKLKNIAGPTIKFLGNVSDEKLISYYNNARALLFPGREDFGLSVVEAQRFGTPVIAYRSGGAVETIVEGKTGLFFGEQSVSSLTQALEKFQHMRYNERDCIAQGKKFSKEKFKVSFMKEIERIMQERKHL